MHRFQNTFAVVPASLMLALVLSAATPKAFAQDDEKTFGDSFTPLVYQVENTGAHYRAPNFPSFSRPKSRTPDHWRTRSTSPHRAQLASQ